MASPPTFIGGAPLDITCGSPPESRPATLRCPRDPDGHAAQCYEPLSAPAPSSARLAAPAPRPVTSERSVPRPGRLPRLPVKVVDGVIVADGSFMSRPGFQPG